MNIIKNVVLIITILLISGTTIAFADYRITRGPDVGEIYFIGPTATGEGIYHSINFGETAVCMDSTLKCKYLLYEYLCRFNSRGSVWLFNARKSIYFL